MLPYWEDLCYWISVRVIALKTVRQFWHERADAEAPLKAWHAEVRQSSWQTPQDIKDSYRSASFVGNNRVVFNIGGNKYRLVVHVRYDLQIVFIRFIGTHQEYDRVDASSV